MFHIWHMRHVVNCRDYVNHRRLQILSKTGQCQKYSYVQIKIKPALIYTSQLEFQSARLLGVNGKSATEMVKDIDYIVCSLLFWHSDVKKTCRKSSNLHIMATS